MPDWRSELQKLVRFGDRLPDHLRQVFHAEPPSDRPWPEGLPSSQALMSFYSLSDGGNIGSFHISGRNELMDLGEWSSDEEYAVGRYLIFGDTEFGHPLVWDSAEDRVGYHDQDGADGLVMSGETGAEMMGLSLDAFFAYILSRHSDDDDEQARSWIETLDALDRIA